ncbi:MAG: hypothetical protein CMJ05_08455 [Pelagibacterales bacterium]|nr:hypothetical protein [Pelagibacterales bacterium]|tara:strand:- start:1737 stop:2999 length:1263 start_codon:yes stop_codon:yes gene_type:complete
MNLIVICSDYPVVKGNAEASLLKFQLNSISKVFKRIILLPKAKVKKKDILSGSEHTIIFNLRTFRFSSIFDFINNFHFLVNDLKKISLSKVAIPSLLRSIEVYSKSIFLFTFLKNYFKKNNLKDNTAIYSFWFDDTTLGALLLKRKYPDLKIFTGAHGHDLFPDRQIGNRIPFRELSINLIDKVLVCSNEGIEYLTNEYPKFKQKIKLLNSGIIKKDFKVKSSDDQKFRILTLSRTDPVKRISYLLKQLKRIEEISKFEIEYFHIGGDNVPGETSLQDLIDFSKDLNFKKFNINFLGKISDDDLNKFFRQSSIDVFLNVSSSEGTCLSLVEAMSYSIPVIVTKVGGNITIGNYLNTGLRVNFDFKDLYEYFENIYYNKSYREQLKFNSHKYWSKYHDSKVLSNEIENIFKSICKPTSNSI